MARIAIHLKKERDKLTVRTAPYWGATPLERGLFLGFRKISESDKTTEGGTWIARQRDADGHQKMKALGHADHVSYDAAAKAACAFAKDVAGGITDEVDTVGGACLAYVADRLQEIGEANANAAAGKFRRHVYGNPAAKIPAHPIAKIPLAKLREKDIKAWRAGLVMKDQSKNNVMAFLRAALNYAARQRWVGTDRLIEWQNVKDLVVVRERREVCLDATERAALLAVMPAHAKPFVRALCLTPLRPGAVAQLTVGNLYKRDRKLCVAKDKHYPGRIISLSGAALDLLAEGCKGKLPGAPIFTDENGKAWNKDSWKKLFEAARVAAELDPRTVAYTLRHSTITEMVEAGVDPFTIAHIAGTSIKKIQEHYFHAGDKHGQAAMEKLAIAEMAA